MKKYNDIYIDARRQLKNGGDEDYNIDARVIVAAAAGKTVSELIRDFSLYATDRIVETAESYVERRLNGEPLAYITESTEFYGIPIIVKKGVLIPRSDTELLVETAIDLLTGRKMDARILDLCTGTGCIACAIAHEMPATRIVAIDKSEEALFVCRKNISALGLTDRVTSMKADVTCPPPMSIGKFDMIISNPPYVRTEEIKTLDSSVKDYEPVSALDGGHEGVNFYKSIIKFYKSNLLDNGYVIFELAEDQYDIVEQMLSDAGFKYIDYRLDTQGYKRAIVARI